MTYGEIVVYTLDQLDRLADPVGAVANALLKRHDCLLARHAVMPAA